MSENQPQVEYWNGDAGKMWAKSHAILDGNMAQLSAVALELAAARPGEHVLDVGCGAGDTTLALTRRITAGGAPGRMVGVDVSEPMLERARERAAASDLDKSALTFVNADAAEHAFAPGSFDLVFSRFGVMFFADPVRAFKNLARATRGRLSFMCWRAVAENPWSHAPLEVARPFLPATPPTPADAPGPFAFADEARTKGILSAAGWRDVTMTAADRPMNMGTTAAEATEFVLTIGPTARAVREAGDPDLPAKVRAKLLSLFERYEKDGAVAMPAGVWLVTARV
jgi:SAM-dependent methyltransferase